MQQPQTTKYTNKIITFYVFRGLEPIYFIMNAKTC